MSYSILSPFGHNHEEEVVGGFYDCRFKEVKSDKKEQEDIEDGLF